MDLGEETVYTSRRALIRSDARRWTPGRLRVSDRAVRFTTHDGAVTEVALAAVAAARVVRLPRRALLLETAAGPVHLRCFAMPAVALLVRS